MQIIIKDESSGKRFMIKGHGLDWEVFKESKGKKKDGKIVGKGNWTSCRSYPSSLDYAVSKVIQWILADEGDMTLVDTTAMKAKQDIHRVLKKRVDQIVLEATES